MNATNARRAVAGAAIGEAKRQGRPALAVLAEHVRASEEWLLAALGPKLRLRTLPGLLSSQELLVWNVVTRELARQHRCVQIANGGDLAAVVIDDPWNDALILWLTATFGKRLELILTSPTAMTALLAAIGQPSHLGASATMATAAVKQGPAASRSSAVDVVGFVQDAIAHGFASQASDIHFESTRAGLQVKLRLDGVLVDHERLAGPSLAGEAISRIKVLAELDIAERRVPQDGRFSFEMNASPVDCRVSVMPSAHGEDAVIRILDKRHLTSHGEALSLTLLGFGEEVRGTLDRLTRMPHGMLLVTGPTGSGKTTTLYAALSEIRSGREKIVTIEDPIEYDVPGVLQVPVNEKKGLTFARGLRSILRHDPDVIMVGEIRDRDTADIAIQSALTGHLVFTTVHANTALDVVSRFTHMGVDLYGLVSCLNGVLAQRLLRLTCSNCVRPDPGQLAGLERFVSAAELESARPRRGAGCDRCRGTGYKGRRAIGEVLVVDDGLRDMLVSKAPISSVKQYLAGRTRPLQRTALDLVISGQTTIDEVLRVVSVA